jgi:outer membrane protein OmpA-like peptidoglycan-associated protein
MLAVRKAHVRAKVLRRNVAPQEDRMTVPSSFDYARWRSASRSSRALRDESAQRARDQARIPESGARVLRERLADLSAQATDRGVVVTLNDMFFGSGRAQLQRDGGRAVRWRAEFTRTYPERTMAIEDFTGSAGNAFRYRLLAERRVRAVQIALIDMGIEPRRIRTGGHGDAFPAASNGAATGRRRNRCVERVISDRDGHVVPRGRVDVGTLLA